MGILHSCMQALWAAERQPVWEEPIQCPQDGEVPAWLRHPRAGAVQLAPPSQARKPRTKSSSVAIAASASASVIDSAGL
ncbi:hypothetical protein GCM10007036_00850 [Alsobacter metallidurans]|uniref:Uncharacterized protein n=1 Tax=Alsobacter metallidurans TaxID=340221 RepID=A0A917I2B0_9HYPH|nr:hypothetical protein GCM10007036_00850 [Alsobacter metallidurans]